MKLLPFEEKIILENERVLLRPLEDSDIDYLLPFSIKEPELWKYSLMQGGGKENLQKYIAHALKKRTQKDSYPFIVFDKSRQQYAGSTRFYDYQSGHNTVQLGFTWYGKSFQGTGLNKNCKKLLLEYAFDKLGIQRVEFRADYNNKRSIAAMKSIGCIEEGVLRSNCAAPGNSRRDSIVLSILKTEWTSSVHKKLIEKIALETSRKSI